MPNETVKHPRPGMLATVRNRRGIISSVDASSSDSAREELHLATIEYTDVETPKVKLPARPVVTGNYQRPPRELSRYVDDYAATLIEG